MDMVLYSLLHKKIAGALTGVQSIKQEDNKLVVTTNDGSKFSITISSPFTPSLKQKLESFSDDLSKITIDENNYLFVDGEKFAKISDINDLEEKVKDLEVGEGGICDWTTNITCGGLASGVDLSGKTVKEVLKAMTVTYVLPSCTVTFSNTNSLIKKGTSINITITSKNFVKGTNDISKIEFYKGTNLENTQTYTTNNNYTYTINDINTDTTLKVRVYDTEGKYKEVSTKSYKFVYPSYVGVSTTDVLTETEITALTKKLEAKGTKTVNYTTSQSYMVFAYPKSYGAINSIIDQNGFNVTDSFTQSTVTVGTVEYYVYCSNQCSGSYTISYRYS